MKHLALIAVLGSSTLALAAPSRTIHLEGLQMGIERGITQTEVREMAVQRSRTEGGRVIHETTMEEVTVTVLRTERQFQEIPVLTLKPTRNGGWGGRAHWDVEYSDRKDRARTARLWVNASSMGDTLFLKFGMVTAGQKAELGTFSAPGLTKASDQTLTVEEFSDVGYNLHDSENSRVVLQSTADEDGDVIESVPGGVIKGVPGGGHKGAPGARLRAAPPKATRKLACVLTANPGRVRLGDSVALRLSAIGATAGAIEGTAVSVPTGKIEVIPKTRGTLTFTGTVIKGDSDSSKSCVTTVTVY